MPPLRFTRVATEIGPMLVAASDRGVAAASRSEAVDAFLAALVRRFSREPELAEVDTSWIHVALSGGPLPSIDLRGISAFDAAVYDVVRAVPPGATMTYGEVAALVGSTAAARAVGGAMSRCPLFPAVPCHRVVRASDGWSGWDHADGLKRRLLERERALREADEWSRDQEVVIPSDGMARGTPPPTW